MQDICSQRAAALAHCGDSGVRVRVRSSNFKLTPFRRRGLKEIRAFPFAKAKTEPLPGSNLQRTTKLHHDQVWVFI
jgi:hypothetical protein